MPERVKLPWHTFDFPEFKTEGRDKTPEKLKFIHMPENLKDQTVLDIGCWDGYFSFVAERRGANYVMATDSYIWQSEFGKELYGYVSDPERIVFNQARIALDSKVRFKTMELNHITRLGKFDVVLCLGILYHVKEPLTFIEKLSKITNKMLILETLTDGNIFNIDDKEYVQTHSPLMVFYPEGYLKDDPTSFWGPNIPCIVSMLKKSGFTKVNVMPQEPKLFPMRVCIHAYKEGFDESTFM